MSNRTLEVVVTGHALSGVTSLTADLSRQLQAAGADVTVDESCLRDGHADFFNLGKKIENLKGVKVTLKNVIVPKGEVGVDSSDTLRFKNGDTFDIMKDRLIGMSELMEITGKSRSTIERWIRDGSFPHPHFQFGMRVNRWVERLVVDFIQENWVTGQPVESAS